MRTISKRISKEELEKILENHKHYLAEDVCDWETMKADLSMAKLSRVDLREANLKHANLQGANLSLSNLSETKLSFADLSGADLSQADLSEANLSFTSLSEANLREAYLGGTCLRRADLSEANLSGAKLRRADLRGANLRRADLRDVDLCGAILMDADLINAKLPDPEIMNSICPLVCPEKGAFIGWKTANVEMPYEAGVLEMVPVIIELQIPECAKRSSATGRKCRCDKALVLDICSLNGVRLSKGTVAHSGYDPTFIYEVGQKLYVDNFDDDRWNECSTGIHFFITKQEAIDYAL